MVQSPFYPGDGSCHVYVLHPPGGLAGGDRLELDVEAAAGTHVLLTTPAATKIYRTEGRASGQRQTVRAHPGSACEWLPQEALVFDGAETRAETRFELGTGARLIAWDAWCLGRPASGEGFTRGRLRQSLEVWVDDAPRLIERLDLRGGAEALHAPWGHAGYAAWSVVLAYPADAAAASAAQTVLQAQCLARGDGGVTLLEDLLVVRVRAPGARALQGFLHPLWGALRPRVLGLAPTAPRIWAT